MTSGGETDASVRVQLTEYGRPALEALAATVRELQGGDPLAPVTVLVPSTYAGLAARRHLASSGGVAGVTFTSLARLAELLAAPVITGRGARPLTGAVRSAAVRSALGHSPGVFADVVDHPATELALSRAHADTRTVTDDDLVAAIGPSTRRAGDVLRAVVAVRAALGDAYYDEHELVRGAAADVTQLGAPRLVLFLPRRITGAEAGLLHAMARAGELVVVAGRSGDATADAEARHTVEALGGAWTDGGVVPTAAHLLAAPDADEEVRTVLRQVIGRLGDGTPLHRMGVLWGPASPYDRILPEHLDAAGVPFTGPGVRRVRDTVAGRTLLAVVDLADSELDRDRVLGLVANAPVRTADGVRVPVNQWDDLTRRAGVTAGRPIWEERMEALARLREADADAMEAAGDHAEWRVEAARREADGARAALAFVVELAESGSPASGDGRARWSELVGWARARLTALLGGPAARARWPDVEAEAFDTVDGVLERLAGLDELEGSTTLAVFTRTLESELDAPVGRHGRFGDGLFVGSIRHANGLELDAVWVLGLVEGELPAPTRDDALLPDADRRRLGPDVPLAFHRVAAERRAFLAALAAAPADGRTLSWPRGDLRMGRQRTPSRWFLESASALAGARVHTDEVDSSCPWVVWIPSFATALAGPAAVGPADDRLSRLAAAAAAGEAVTEHPLVSSDPVLVAAARVADARRHDHTGRFFGFVPSDALAGIATQGVLSATSLETYGTCPMRYFLGRVLRIGDRDTPEDRLDLSPLERGSLVHRVLERFVAAALDDPPDPTRAWNDHDVARLREMAETVCDEFEAEGRTGRPLLWKQTRTALLADFAEFLRQDSAHRARGWRPEAVEMEFGVEHPPAEVELDDGRVLTFRGFVDRVDRAADGRLFVADYKTGKPSGYKDVAKDPVVGGTILQLPLYGLAAEQQLEGGPATASYWFPTTKGGFTQVEVELDDETMDRVRHALAVITDGIEAGRFPVRPGEWNGYFSRHDHCGFCEYDQICPVDRSEAWDGARGAPEMAAYVDLVETPYQREVGADG